MRDLLTQAKDPEQTRNRYVGIVRSSSNQLGIKTSTPNGKTFIIEPNGYPYGEPKVWSRWPIDKGLSSGESTHYFGDGYVCLGHDLDRLELYELLYLIDAWARGFEQYLKTGSFPGTSAEAFGRNKKHSSGFWDLLGF